MSATRGRVLVVDDKDNMRLLLARVLGDHHDVETAADGAAAIARLSADEFDVVLTDVRMPGADGFDVVRASKERWPDTEVILMTAYASVPAAVDAMKQGAYDYLQKPFDPDDVTLVVARALERRRLHRKAAALRRTPGEALAGLVGASPAMKKVQALLRQAAAADLGVLITGESGTGKELAARAIHAGSARAAGPFVPVNCGALPGELVESELFGHARGAFSGATSAKEGLWEAASGGTLFLDEIGELPLALQVKLNRALQDKEIRRVGENRPIQVDVRLVAATNRDLAAAVRDGTFREDLYYRLAVFPVHLPPLRERGDDVLALGELFLGRSAAARAKGIAAFAPETLQALVAHGWPGNVRELENAVERAIAVSPGPLLRPADLPPGLGAPVADGPAEDITRMPYKDFVERARDQGARDYLVALLRRFGGNVTEAADTAAMERESLHRLLKRFGVRAEDFRASKDAAPAEGGSESP